MEKGLFAIVKSTDNFDILHWLSILAYVTKAHCLVWLTDWTDTREMVLVVVGVRIRSGRVLTLCFHWLPPGPATMHYQS